MTDAGPAWEDPRRVLARHGLVPKRGLSQSFLVARSVVDRIAEAVAPAPNETVVELGPGLGTLTGALLRAGARVVAVERDRDMLAVLEAELGASDALVLCEGDAAAVDYAAIEAQTGAEPAVAGNLPYAITGAILRNLVAQAAHISRAVLMVQREVRDRLLASPGTKAWGALTVFTTNAFTVEPIVNVTPGSFHPPPRVSSAVVRLTPRERPRAVEDDAFRGVVRAIFDARRKTLRNALRAVAEPDAVDRALEAAAIDHRVRGETLDVEALDALAWALCPVRRRR